MKERTKSVIVELQPTKDRKEAPFPHEQYNTRHEVQAIPNFVREEVWRIESQPKIRQSAIVHLLLAGEV